MAGHIGKYQCPTGKRVYESEKYALNGLRWMREHGEIRRGEGHVYPCRRKGIALHFHITSSKRRTNR